MLKEQAKFFNRVAVLFDLLTLLAAMALAYGVRARWGGLQPFHSYIWIVLIASVVWYFLLSRYHLYESLRLRGAYDIITSLFDVHLAGGCILAGLIFLLTARDFSRGLFLAFLGFSWLLMCLERLAVRQGQRYFRSWCCNFRNVVIVGSQEKARVFIDLVANNDDWGFKVLGRVQVAPDDSPAEVSDHQVLGQVQELVEICKTQPVDEVIFFPPSDFVFDVESYLKGVEELGITTRVVLDFYDVSRARKSLELFLDQVPVLTFHCKTLDAQQLFLKRLLDICGALVGLTITLVLLPFIAVAIKRDSPGPILFGQQRVGLGGRRFRCWKFRTMYVDAEARKQELLAKNEMNGAMFKIKDDPRITRVGRFLRRTSLDELPQFWNVLIGEMSLVGTRPPIPEEVSQYENWHRRRIIIKPGITGKWQVSGRNRISDFNEIARLDLDYISNWTLWLDIKILLKTLKVVFVREGSY